MNHLAKLYLDEDVSVLLGKILAGRGFDVLTARDAGMLQKSDEQQLLFAIEHSHAIVTQQPPAFRKTTLGIRAKTVGARRNRDRRPS